MSLTYKSSSHSLLAMITIYGLCSLAFSLNFDRMCGKRLADMLDLVCADRGFYWEVKRSSTENGEHTQDVDEQSESDVAHDGMHSIQKRGVVEECCRQRCTLSVLETYCAPAMENLDTDALLQRIAVAGSGSSASSQGNSGSDATGMAIQPTPVPSAQNLRVERPRPQLPKILRNHPYFFVTPTRRMFNAPNPKPHY